MGDKPKRIYAPGELDAVRKRLKVSDPDEARRMSRILGGEIGEEKLPEPPKVAPTPKGKVKAWNSRPNRQKESTRKDKARRVHDY